MADNASTFYYDRAVDRAAMVRLYEKRTHEKVEEILKDHAVKVEGIVKSQRKATLLHRMLGIETDRAVRQAYNVSKRSLLDLARDQMSFAYQGLSATVGDIFRPKIPPRALIEDIVLKRPLHSDKTLEQLWGGIAYSEKKRLSAVIRRGIAEGMSPERLAYEIRKGNVHKISRNHSRSIVTTATTSVHAQADHAVLEVNKDVLVGWQYVAILDGRTTPICAARDGEVFPIGDVEHLPPAHHGCRSKITPVFKSWEDVAKLESAASIRKRNLANLTDKQRAFYDGQSPMRESYAEWLARQPEEVKLRHLGDSKKLQLFNEGKLSVANFTGESSAGLGIKDLRRLTDSGYTLPNDTRRFATAKAKLEALHLPAVSPDDFYENPKLRGILMDYYRLQSSELDGHLSLVNYRGTLIGTKKSMRRRVLTLPPREDQLVFNPITGRYEDVRLYQPNVGVLNNNIRLVRESKSLLDKDKEFIEKFVEDLGGFMGANERAAVSDNLRIIFGRYRENKELWGSFKGVSASQMKFDVMNVSASIETQIRKDSDALKKLLQANYIDPVLGPVQLQELHDNFINNIIAKNDWEDRVAPKIATELQGYFSKVGIETKLPPVIYERISKNDLHQFYHRFAHRLSLADLPDRDQFAMDLGRDLYNMANLNGDRRKWYQLGLKFLESDRANKFFEIETYGVQKRRLKSRMTGKYFGPYYDTLSYNIRIVDPRIQRYSQLVRKVDVGLRVGVTTDKNRLLIRKGYKTYFIDRGILGLEDTRIPITSSFGDFPTEFIDDDLVNALNWASSAEYRIDGDYYDAIKKLLYFEDDKGRAKYFNELNELRKHFAARSDTYERLKAMEWLRDGDKAFSNHPFLDHRGRVYDRGLIGPQSGETYRPFLNTKNSKALGVEGYHNFQDQVGQFLGGLDDYFEGTYNSLSFTGRQKIAEKWRPELVKIGNHMLRGKPNDLRAILEHPLVMRVEGEELPKFLRFALESAKVDSHLLGDYTKVGLQKLANFKTALALEQDASSSGAQIIALTTKNKRLAALSNVIPTSQKQRLYDEIAAATFNDPRFRKLNMRLGLTEKDLRKASKAQNMVECCHV